MMLAMLHDLSPPQGIRECHADARHPPARAAAEDYELRRLFHHILIANRFWLMLRLGRDFLFEAEARVPETWEILAARSGNAHAGTEVARSSDGRRSRTR